MENNRFFMLVGLELPLDDIAAKAKAKGITDIKAFCQDTVTRLINELDKTEDFNYTTVGNIVLYDSTINEEEYKETGRSHQAEQNFINFLKNE